MRIAIGGIAHETNTFSALPTTLEDFTVLRGGELLAGGQSELFWNDVTNNGHEAYPLLRAYATPSGKVTKPAFETLLTELVEGLAACGRLDGVLLHLHGAMEVEDIGDGETAILAAVRECVGPEPLVAVSLDLHANLAPAVAEMADIITAYRTAPHRDVEETRIRCARLLLKCLDCGERPAVALVKLPLLVAGEAAVTEVPPARDLFAQLPAYADGKDILDASILIGCAWTDSPFTTVSTIACGLDSRKAGEIAADLAREVWQRRADFAIDSECANPADAIAMAFESQKRPVFISDSGDNPTAGAAGDSPFFLKTLIDYYGELGATGGGTALVSGIADPMAADRCLNAVGATVDLNVGGKLDTATCKPLDIIVEVLKAFPEDPVFGNSALVRVGRIDLVVQSRRRPFTVLQNSGQSDKR